MIKPDGGVLNINQDSRTFDASADGEYTFAVTTKIYPSYTAEIRICLVVGTTGIPFVAASQPQVVNADANGNAECNATSTAMTLFAAEGTTLVAEFNKDINSVIGSIPTEVLSNKSIVVDGDSITEGVGNSPYKGWAEYIAESFNMSLTNSAKAGATIATGTKDSLGNNWRWLCESVANLLPSDYVIVSGGYNDYANSVPMGEYANEIESNPNTATFYGACEKMCQNLINNFTTKKIGFVFTHKITDSWYRANSQGKTMIDYHDALVKVLNKYCIPYCDLFNDGQFNTAIPSLQGYAVSPIGVHPNDMGYRLFYVDKIKAFLKNL
jgi:lysophospholipase L1-like esterase